MTIAISGTNGVTLSGQFDSASSFGFKNRIINGAMVIDQRNAGASVTPSANAYTLDRWFMSFGGSATSKMSYQQSSVGPTGFINSILATVVSAYSVTGSDSININQRIEGLNTADLAWGTASAATVTLSFWVRSSLTGTFGGAIKNNDATRSYPFSYAISSANTWEQKSVTVSGDTTGTWLTNNGIGLIVNFSLANGGTTAGTAGAWASANYNSATGAVNVVATLGATFYITGVQLEKGSTATSFDYRPYGTELALCQRYYFRNTQLSSILAEAGFATATTNLRAITKYPVPMRTAPTALEQTGTATDYRVFGAGASITACNSVPTFNSATEHIGQTNFSVASGLTAYTAGTGAAANGITAYLGWSAEL